MNNRGYTLKELLIVLGIVSLLAIISIAKISFAFSDIDNTEDIKYEENKLIKKAADIYAKQNIEKVKENKELYVSGKELIDSKVLANSENYNDLKVKITYNEKSDKYNITILNK